MTYPKIEFDYHVSIEQLRAYRAMPDIDKLRWLDGIVCFTLLWRGAGAQSGTNSGEYDRRDAPV